MGLFSRFENKMEDTVEGAANRMAQAPISPVQIEKKAEKQMKRETMVGAGKEFAPTLYTVLVNPDDDQRLFGYYPTLAGEIETYLQAKAVEEGLVMDGQPLVRFIVDDGLRHGKFDVIAEPVAAPIVAQLRQEEMVRYGLAPAPASQYSQPAQGAYADPYQQQYAPQQNGGYYDQPQGAYDDYQGGYQEDYQQPAAAPQQDRPQRGSKPPLPYVPEDEIDYSIDYGEYTFDSEDFEDYRDKAEQDARYGAHRRNGAHGAPAEAAAGAAAGAIAGAAAGAAIGTVTSRPARDAQAAGPNTVGFAGNAGMPDHRNVQARLINIAYQRAYDLGSSTVTLGRESGNDIVIQDISASRKHAQLTCTPQGVWVIADLGSTNGTIVNGVSIATQPLRSGDRIVIGKTEFQFVQ